MLDRTTAPAIAEIGEITIAQAHVHKTHNGRNIYVLSAGEQDLLKVDFVYNAGTWHEDKTRVSYMTLHMLQEGTQSYNSSQIAEKIAYYGAFLEMSHATDRVNITLYVLSKYLQDILPVVEEVLYKPVFPEEELQLLKTKMQQSLKVNKEKTSYIASKEFSKTLFPNHPYGQVEEADDIEKVTVADLQKFYSEYYTPQNMEVFVSGKVTAKDLQTIEGILSKVQDRTMPAVKEYTTQDVQGVNVHIDRKDAVQTSLRMGYKLIKRDHPDYAGVLILNEIFGGYFGSRLMKNIREEKGYTYGIYSSVVSLKNEGYWTIGADVKKEFAADAISEIKKEITLLREQQIEEEELERVKKYMLGSFMNQLNTPFDLMDRFRSIHFSGLTYRYYEKYLNTIKNITAAELQQLAIKYMHPDKLNVVRAG